MESVGVGRPVVSVTVTFGAGVTTSVGAETVVLPVPTVVSDAVGVATGVSGVVREVSDTDGDWEGTSVPVSCATTKARVAKRKRRMMVRNEQWQK